MLIKSRKLSVISLVMFVAVIAWPITGLSCGAGTKQYIIGGTPTCVSIVTNGVDAEITLVPTQSNPNPTWASTGITNFALSANPTSPLACGGTHDDDCDDIKEAEHEEKSSSIVGNTATVAASAQVLPPPPPPSGLVSCSLPHDVGSTPGDDFLLVPVPGTTIVSQFTGSSSAPDPHSNTWIITSNALNEAANVTTLAAVCATAISTLPTSTESYVSTPTDFVPCNLKSKVNATVPNKTIKPTTLTCALPANECTGVPKDSPLVIDDSGKIGLQIGILNDGDNSPIIGPLPYNCN